MSLTNDEQHALEMIERGLRHDDPLLADHFAAAPTADQRQRRAVWARRLVAVGATIALLGLIASDGLISLGAILCGYGLVILSVAACVAVRNRTPSNDRRRRDWRA
jgi:hypothetical protein